jgi:hypothetical protein
VAHILAEKSFQIYSVEDDCAIEQGAPAAFDPMLRFSVPLGTLLQSLNRIHLHGPHCRRNVQAALGVTIKDEEPRIQSRPNGLLHSLNQPHASWDGS